MDTTDDRGSRQPGKRLRTPYAYAPRRAPRRASRPLPSVKPGPTLTQMPETVPAAETTQPQAARQNPSQNPFQNPGQDAAPTTPAGTALISTEPQREGDTPAITGQTAGQTPDVPAPVPDPAESQPPVVHISHRFLRGLLPNRAPHSYLLSPPNLLTRRAEDFRELRARIKLLLGESGVILVASPRHGEGRSITALNLGLAFAQEYERVVYVEADFRRPALHAFFEIEPGRGLARLLRRQEPLDDDCGDALGDELYPTDVPGFYLLAAGVRAGPPEVFASPRMAEVVARLRAEADWAIIDAAPMLTYAEPLALARLVDGVVVVALEGRTRDDDVTRLASRLNSVNARVLGATYLQRS